MSGTDPPAEAVEALPDLLHATVAPDGERVAYYLTEDGRPRIEGLDLRTGERTVWTEQAGASAVWPLFWDAAGDRLYFHRDDSQGGEEYDLHAVDPSGTVERLTATAGPTHLRDVADDGSTLLVRSAHEGGMDAYLFDLDARELTPVIEREGPVYYPALSGDGRRVAHAVDGELHLHDRTGARLRTVAVDGLSEVVRWGPADRRLVVGGDRDGTDVAGVYDLEAGTVTWLGGATHVETPAFLLPGGARLLVARRRGARTVPVVYDLETGTDRELELPPGVSYLGEHGVSRATRVLGPDRLLLVHTTGTRLGDLVVYDLGAHETETVLERDHGPFDPTDFVAPVHEPVTSDGVPETPMAAVSHGPRTEYDVGTLFYDAGVRPSPLVVYPHGGPNLRDQRAFDPRVQYLCRQGYAVLQVNYRGSSGRGRAFAEAGHGDWGGGEAGDIARAVERTLATHDFLDPDRVAVYGASFGGYAACWQLVQYPALYAAGASVAGMTDLVDMHETTAPQFRTGLLEAHLGPLEENRALYRERSPTTHVETLATPLLVVQPENDPRVPVSQGRRLRDACRERGLEVSRGGALEYHELEGTGHFGSTGPSEALRLLTDFLDRRL